MKKVKCEMRSHIGWHFPIHSSILHCQRIVMLYNKKIKVQLKKVMKKKRYFRWNFPIVCSFCFVKEIFYIIKYYILHHI